MLSRASALICIADQAEAARVGATFTPVFETRIEPDAGRFLDRCRLLAPAVVVFERG